MIYFDSTATTKPLPEILELYQKVNETYWYNTESLYKEGSHEQDLMNHCCEKVKKVLGLTHKKVYFTSGATESNNLLIQGIADNYPDKKVRFITSQIEHSSVLHTFKKLEEEGFDVVYLPVDDKGCVSLTHLKEALTQNTVLVSIMWVNNIMGSIQPIQEILNLVHQYPRCKFHMDAVQGIGKVIPNFSMNDCDAITFTAHKIHGLKGTGFLVCNEKIILSPLLRGGHQQDGIRGGTMDVAGVVCATKALEIAVANTKETQEKLKELYDYCYQGLKNNSHLILHDAKEATSHSILHFSMKNVKGETMVHFLEQKGILVGTGSACDSHSKELDATIMALTQDATQARDSIRVSLSKENTIQEIDQLLLAIKEIGEQETWKIIS
jgi:cysteine desulfurase